MDLTQWCQLDEAIHISETDEEYKQYAGFDYSEKMIEQLAELKLSNSKIFLNYFSSPRTLVLGALEDIAYSKTKRLELELHNARNMKIVSSTHEFNASPVNWSTWRQFNSFEGNHANRQKVFDEFITKTKYISPIIEERFSSIKQVYEEYQGAVDTGTSQRNKINPLSAYLENENISYDELVDFIKSLGDRAKKPFS